MKILIVEDEKISQEKIKIILSKFGICDVTANGQSAVEMFKKAWEDNNPYDLVTLDINIEGQDGLSVLMELREIEEKKEISPAMRVKVLVVSSHHDKDHVTSSATIGVDGYIVKPFSNESISKALKEIYLEHINNFF